MVIGKTYTTILLGALLALPVLSSPGFAADAVSAGHAWARATAPGQNTAGVYMELVSAADAALVGIETPVAARAQMHSMRMDDGVMRMRALEKIDLPAGKAVKLAPGGLHVMLLDLKQPLKVGDTLPLTLSVRSASGLSMIRIVAEVRAVGAPSHGH